MKNVLTIAGSDSSGGAGIQADLKTFSAHGVYGMSVITAITAQSTRGVFGVQNVDPEIIRKQLDVLFEDIEIHAIKIGMVSTIETIEVIADFLENHRDIPLVVDPVMVSKSGFHLLDRDAKDALIRRLLPLANLLTPNLPEAEVITDLPVTNLEEMKTAGESIRRMGPDHILMKGGHLSGQMATDLLYDGNSWQAYPSIRVQTKNTHGTGCTLSASLAANLANGLPIHEAVQHSKAYIDRAIASALSIGTGPGPVHHFHPFYDRTGKGIHHDET